MLFAYPTTKGTGITIYGDYYELNSLYKTVHQISKSLEDNITFKGQHQTLMNFAYEIRKAYSGNRELKRLKNQYEDRDEMITFFGFKVVWTDILIFINILRGYAGYSVSSKRDQANLYSLEDVVERAMIKYDEKGALALKHSLNGGLFVSDKFIFVLYQAIHIKFVTQKPGKLRFRNTLKILNSFLYSYTDNYKELIGTIEGLASQNQSDPLNFEYDEFPDIKW